MDAPVIYTGAFPILTAWPGRRSLCNRTSPSDSLVSYLGHSYFSTEVQSVYSTAPADWATTIKGPSSLKKSTLIIVEI